MSRLQEVTVKTFLDCVGKKTFDQYSEMTGIERTRLFRIFHGAEMKLKEFEIFQCYLRESHERVINWGEVLDDINSGRKSGSVKKDFRVLWDREQRLKEYLTLAA